MALTKITRGQRFLYALPSFPHSFAFFPIIAFVPAFYSTELGLPLELVGIVLFATRITDVFTDPLIGRWSDRTRSRFGRRKPFIAAGIPILILCIWRIFVPGESATIAEFFVWMFVLYVAYTFITLPFGSWGAELSNDYDERSKIKAWRGMSEMLGTLTALSVPLVLSLFGYTETATVLFTLAIIFTVLQPLAFGITLRFLPEPPIPPRKAVKHSLRKQASIVLSNSPATILLSGFMLLIIGLAIGGSLNLIFITAVVEAKDLFPVTIALENVVGVLSIPVWVLIAGRLGKHIAAAIAAAWFGVLTLLTWFLGTGDGWAFVSIIALRGASIGAFFFLGASMIADIVDVDELKSGEQRTGLFFALLGMVLKLAGAFGVLLGTAIPPMFGFQPSDEVHSPEALEGLRVVFAFIAPPFALFAMVLFLRYPLGRAEQQKLQEDIDQSRAATAREQVKLDGAGA